tara:strand:+ start:1477 stop:1866 length:390 start_codon:yes stop_codon:yes gene_type:complete
MAKSAAQRFKEQRAKMKFYNENVVHPNAPVNKLTSEEFKQLQRNRDKKYNQMINRILSQGRVFGPLTLGIMQYGGKAIDNVKRVFAPSDQKIIQDRLKKNYRNLIAELREPALRQFKENIRSGRIGKKK